MGLVLRNFSVLSAIALATAEAGACSKVVLRGIRIAEAGVRFPPGPPVNIMDVTNIVNRMEIAKVQNSFKNWGLKVNDISFGSDGLFNSVPQIVFEVANETEFKSQKQKLQTLIYNFYKAHLPESNSKIKIASISGLGINKKIPEHGFIVYVGALDSMEFDTGIEDFDIYNKTHDQVLTKILLAHQAELESFCRFISEQ